MTPNSDEIAFVIVHHDNVLLTQKCVESIAASAERSGSVRIIIVDNSESSTHADNLTAALGIWNSNPKIAISLITSENIGYFRSANLAIALWRDNPSTSYTIICNNDLLFHESFCEELRNIEYPEAAMVVYPDLLSSGGRHENPRETSYIGAARLLAYRLYYSSYLVARCMRGSHGLVRKIANGMMGSRGLDKPSESRRLTKVIVGVGACVILTDRFSRTQLDLPSEVFLFGEEVLLAEQVLKQNGEIYYDNQLKVVHREHSTVGRMPGKTYWQIQKESAKSFVPALWRIRSMLKSRRRGAEDEFR